VFASCIAGSRSSGMGPMGLSVIDQRHVLVADKLQNSVLLVDYLVGGVVARRTINHTLMGTFDSENAATWPDLVGVATCPSCDFAWVSANLAGKLYRINFETPLTAAANPVEMARLLFESALVSCDNCFPDWSESTYKRETKSALQPRIVMIDSKGEHAYLTRHDGKTLLFVGQMYSPGPRCLMFISLFSSGFVHCCCVFETLNFMVSPL
jgi:hypothetical protein